MNNGAFGENFPYSNFHDLNMNWIIKIAKDFLDQYTHIQETIDNGLEALDEKATNLEALLQEWYDTHSQDIANELQQALVDIQSELLSAITEFNQRAEEKAAQTIASIPSDYTTLANAVTVLENSLKFIVPAPPNNLKINITDTQVIIPAYTRMYYANNLIFRTQEVTTINRTASSADSPSEEYIYFDSQTGTFSSSAGPYQSLGANKYLLMTLSKSLNGSSLSPDFVTWNGGERYFTSFPALITTGTDIDLNNATLAGVHTIPASVTTIENGPFVITNQSAGAYVLENIVIGTNALLQNIYNTNDKSICFTRYRNDSGTWTAWKNTYLQTAVTAKNPFNFNDVTTSQKIYIAGWINAGSSNPPITSTSYCMLTSEKSDNGVVTQTATYPEIGKQFIRRINTLGEFSDWLSTTYPHYTAILSGEHDLNQYITEGVYCFNTLATFTNAPEFFHNCVSVYDLKVFKFPPANVLYQELTDPIHGRRWIRYRSGNGTFDVWKNIGDQQLSIMSDSPFSRINFTRSITRKTIQDIAVFNKNIFEIDTGVIVINGKTSVNVQNGHGNTAMFGVTPHGDFPYLYIGSWNRNDCKIYVFSVTETSAIAVRTISYPNLTGFLNMCVDESNSKIYILLCTSAESTGGEITLIVSDMNGNIESQTALPYLIPVVQGMEFYNGSIYITYGGVDGIPSKLMNISTTGTILYQSQAIPVEEIEGISIDNGTMYIADKTNIYF